MNTQDLYSSIFPIFSRKFKSISLSVAQRIYPVPLRIHNKSAQKNPAKHKLTSHDKIPKRISAALFIKKKHSKATRKRSNFQKKVFQFVKIISLPTLTMTLYGALRSPAGFCEQQQEDVEFSGSYKAKTCEVSTSNKSHVPD